MYGHLFEQPATEVITVLPERTFWEKITILHREAFRSREQPFPARYSRHYYDLYRMADTPVKDKALKNKQLLEQVVAFKDKFYHCAWARYDLAIYGSIRLLPPKYNLTKLEDDYERMQNMLFGEKPGFFEVMTRLENLEWEINRLK